MDTETPTFFTTTIKRCTVGAAAAAASFVSFILISRANAPHVHTNTWSSTGDMTTARTGASAVLLYEGEVLVTGGLDANGASATTERYSPDGGQFIQTASMSTARANHSSTLLPGGRADASRACGAHGDAAPGRQSADCRRRRFGRPDRHS